MAKDGAGTAAINGDSVACLEDVKKGKPRKFVMVSKGTSVISLVVYKKGSAETHKKAAKEGGKGQLCFGVVDGKGQDLRFVLARADGYEAEPVKAVALRAFLEEEGQVKSKAYFEIVDQLLWRSILMIRW